VGRVQPAVWVDVEDAATEKGRGRRGGETGGGRRGGIERVEGAFGGGGN